MAPRALIVDGFDTSEEGLIVRSGIQGWRGTPQASYPSTTVPGRMGAVRLSREPQYEPRQLTIPASVEGATMAEMHANLRSLERRLWPGPERTIRLVDDETVEFRARTLQIDGQGVPPDLTQPLTQVAISLLALDPRLLAVSDTVVNFTSSLTETELGSGPSFPVIRIDGAATDPVLTYADHTGATVKTLGLTISLGASDWVEIDMMERTIVDDGGTDRADALTSGGFFKLDPSHGTADGDSDPQLSVSDGSGTATYRKAY